MEFRPQIGIMSKVIWHKASEEKPNKFGLYLCKINRNSNFSYEIVLWCEDGGFWNWYTDSQNVVAWAEIPKCDIE